MFGQLLSENMVHMFKSRKCYSLQSYELVALMTSQKRYSSHSSQSLYFADTFNANESKFSKILIANRGEIACRVIKTCKYMGIKTVAIHSDIDSNALHVSLADERYCVGSALSKDSYLNVDAIVDAIRKSGAEAVHPGYGFLSENTDFAKRLEDMGVTFIGPNWSAIHALGDKIESKKIAKKAGVHTIPGFEGEISEENCVRLANQIGYPVIIKPSAGGGGKGMHIAYNDHELLDGYRFGKQESAAWFADNRLLLEKYVEKPRHIEIQVLCDKHGNAIYLNERECTIQRRNQKVIEEAPSCFVDADLRKRMGEQAVGLALDVGYDSAGTVEFLVDVDKNFYFLEMNTRLQVEHPVTEYITGIDLVHQMIRIAKGYPLTHNQKDVQINGWAFESRVYAEDPYKIFGLPSIGRLTKYKEPLHMPNVRCDSGVIEGSDINIYYDPLICKLVTYGSTRQEALNTMTKALDEYVIRGLTHNIPLLRDIMTEKNFVSGNISTKYLKETYPEGFTGKQLTNLQLEQLSAISAAIFVRDNWRSKNFLNTVLTNDSLNSKDFFNEWNLIINVENGKNSYPALLRLENNKFIIDINNNKYEFPSNISMAASLLEFAFDSHSETVQLISMDGTGKMRIQFQGTIYEIHVMPKNVAEYYKLIPLKPKVDVSKVIKSPMPGLVKSVSCSVGDTVIEGQEVCVIEAMKMQNSLTITTSGKVKLVNCKAGDTVEDEEILVELE